MQANRLQLNPTKTEVLWCAPPRCQNVIPSGPVCINSSSILPVTSVRDLGVYIDTDVAIKTHVTNTIRGCFSALRQIRSVRRSLSRHALMTLVRALVVSKVDYCNAVLVGIPEYLQKRLQSLLNAAALLIYSAKKYDHITPLLRELHWLRVPERIHQFRLCVLAYRCLTGTAPQYLVDTLSLSTNVAARCLRCADSRTLQLPSTRRTRLGNRAFSVAAARAWNSLPPEIRNSDSLLTFRGMDKTYLFQLSFAN